MNIYPYLINPCFLMTNGPITTKGKIIISSANNVLSLSYLFLDIFEFSSLSLSNPINILLYKETFSSYILSNNKILLAKGKLSSYSFL